MKLTDMLVQAMQVLVSTYPNTDSENEHIERIKAAVQSLVAWWGTDDCNPHCINELRAALQQLKETK